MSRRFTWKVVSCLVATLVMGASHANAAVLSFNNLAGWQAAAGAESWVVDFSAFAVDTQFRTAAVDAGPFSLDEIGGDDFRNLIDVSPYQFSDNPGTTHASMFTNFGGTTVNMQFDSPVQAWGADFYAIDGELLDLVLNFVGGGTAIINVPGGSGFTGFTSDTAVASITFQSRNNAPGPGGEGFPLDNVRGVTVPEPATLLLFATAGGALVRRMRQRRA